MPQNLTYLKETASQTAGPYVHIGLAPGAAGFDIYERELGHDIVGPEAKGERIRVEGRVIDGMGAPIKDVLIEVWQANAEGNYAHPEGGGPVEPGFRGWGRVISDFDTGEWRFETVKPGIILCLGAPAAKTIIDKNFKITKDRGKWYEAYGAMAMATFHPAYVLRQQGEELNQTKRLVWQDIQNVYAEYQKIMEERG